MLRCRNADHCCDLRACNLLYSTSPCAQDAHNRVMGGVMYSEPLDGTVDTLMALENERSITWEYHAGCVIPSIDDV